MDNRYGDRDNRWRERDQGERYEERGGYGQNRDERGFMERAGEEVRSWFGSDYDGRREQGMTRRDNQTGGAMRQGGGWGNQAGESWNRDRPGAHGSYGAYGAGDDQERSGSSWGNESSRGYGDRQGSNWGAASNSMSRDHSGSTGARGRSGWEGRSQESNRGYGEPTSAGAGGGGGPEVFGSGGQGGTSGFGGSPDHGRRFDRIDPGHVGAHGAHPMSAPVGGGYGGGGISAGGGYSSSARAYAAERQGDGQGSSSGGSTMGGGMSGGRQQDPHYSEWRNRQIESIDRDYDEYRREHQSRFEQDFGQWRTKRGEQRQHMSRVTEHMEVVGSDGEKIGIVDAVHGDRIVLTKNDENAGGHHHSIPCSWIERVEDKVTVNKSREEAMRAWRDEERSRALFEREGSGSTGPHVLNRSFSGTY